MLKQNKNKKENTTKTHYKFWSIISVILFLVFIVFLIISQSPRPTLVAKMNKNNEVLVNSELQIDFSLPVSRQVAVEITPPVYGELAYENMVLSKHLARTVVFKPEVTWLPATTYEIKITNVRNAFLPNQKPKEHVLTFTTEKKPNIQTVLPAQDEVISPENSWQITLDKANNNLIDYEFRFTPYIETATSLSEDKKTYTVKPGQLLAQGQEYSLEIVEKEVRYFFDSQELAYQAEGEAVWQGSFTVREAPGLESFSPQGNNIGLNEQLTVVFDENVDMDSFNENVVIEPELAGSWQTDDYKTLTLKPTSLAKDTTYTVTFKQGLRTYEGGYLEEEVKYQFTTTGPVRIASSSPANGSQGVTVGSRIRLIFNQAVDQESAQGKFSISPTMAGSFSWENNTMTFTPDSNLNFNTAYTVTLAKGIVSQAGFDSEENLSFSFSTEYSVIKLSVPFHRQEHNLSCEVATLVMALAYRGINVSESTLIEMIGVDPTEKSGGVWGNPHLAFVGDIDGKQPTTGYGVYWQPIAQAAQNWRTANWFTDWSLTDLTAEIKKGNPVIVWGTAGSGTRIDWKTPQGGNVVAVNGEHTRVAIGFIGSADNPTKIITLDPLSGEKYFTKSSFLWNWGLLNNSGVVVE